MNYNLICNSKMEKVIKEILRSKGMKLDKSANTVFIDKSCEIPADSKIYICFDSSDLNGLMNFIDAIKSGSEDKKKNVITGKIDDKYEIISYGNIIFFEANNNIVECYTIFGKRYRIKEKLYELEVELDKEIFIRISKSYIVNFLSISEIIPWFGGRLRLKFQNTKVLLEVTRSYSKQFKKFLGL